MITYTLIACPSDKKKKLKDFNPRGQTWLVSDLHSKLELQNLFVEDASFLEEDSVLRASELWKKLLFRVRPSLELVSKEFLLVSVQGILEKRGVDDEAIVDVSAQALDYVQQLLPLLCHPRGDEMLREWFGSYPQGKTRWFSWYELSLQIWKMALQQGFIGHSWAGGVLLNEFGFEQFWKRKLVVDLGVEINQIDVELLQHMGRYLEIEVLVPCPPWALDYDLLLKPYGKLLERDVSDLIKEAKLEEVSHRQENGNREYLRFTTMLGEAKEAVARIRTWIDQGVSPEKIAIVSPKIEMYWPVLEGLLNVEGVFAAKNMTTRYQSFKEVQRWLCGLKLLVNQPESEDLETEIFATEEEEEGALRESSSSTLHYEKFKVIFSSLYDRSDLERSQKIKDRYLSSLSRKTKMNRTEFVSLALKCWPGEKRSELLEGLLQEIIKECRPKTVMNMDQWLQYLEFKACKKEVILKKHIKSGVRCTNLLSVDYGDFSKIVFCGLMDSELKQKEKTQISFMDILSLSEQFGFNLTHVEKSLLEFEVRWVLDINASELVVTTASTDFSSRIESPSQLWLEGAQRENVDLEKVSVPKMTRWDYLQRQEKTLICEKKNWDNQRGALLCCAVAQDLGSEELELFPPNRSLRLSASGLETYLEFPFLYAIKYLFHLSDLPSLDLDVDAMTRGNLMHGLFEQLTETPMKFDYTNEEILSLIDRCRRDYHIHLADERLWPPLRKKYLQLARRFLKEEKEYRQKFPDFTTVAREAKIEGYVNTVTGKLSSEAKENGEWWPFKGAADRVDQDAFGNVVILDYKSSNNGLKQFSHWVEKRKLQLALYAQAMENGLVPSLKVKEVEGAFYYVSRTMERFIGFKQKENSGHLFDCEDMKRNKILREEKQELYKGINQLVSSAIKGIREGHFEPFSEDTKYELAEEWKNICRIPERVNKR